MVGLALVEAGLVVSFIVLYIPAVVIVFLHEVDCVVLGVIGPLEGVVLFEGVVLDLVNYPISGLCACVVIDLVVIVCTCVEVVGEFIVIIVNAVAVIVYELCFNSERQNDK